MQDSKIRAAGPTGSKLAEEDTGRLIGEIMISPDSSRRLQLLERLRKTLLQKKSAVDGREFKKLLCHHHWYIRREAAFLIDEFGISLSATDMFLFHYALADFETLYRRMDEHKLIRKLLFSACRDASPKIRSRALAVLSFSDCRLPAEEVLLHFASGDFCALVELAGEPDYRRMVVRLLKLEKENIHQASYIRRQCAFALENLNEMESAHRFAAGLLKSDPPVSTGGREMDTVTVDPPGKLLLQLNSRGIRVNGRQLYPKIEIGSKTGRITYKEPPLQNWPKSEREKQIQPPAGYEMYALDFVAFEPHFLLHFLLAEFYLSMEKIPAGDLYSVLCPKDRQAGKDWLLRLINGGNAGDLPAGSTFSRRILQAVKEWRQQVFMEVHKRHFIETLTGRTIPVLPDEVNWGGKACNRIIQGSASDFFIKLLLQIQEAVEENHWPLSIVFLLHDEIWLAVLPESAAKLIHTEIPELVRITGRQCGLLLELPFRIKQLPQAVMEGGI
ncbi:MAG: DNA polymerase [Calditrichia bacterium]